MAILTNVTTIAVTMLSCKCDYLSWYLACHTALYCTLHWTVGLDPGVTDVTSYYGREKTNSKHYESLNTLHHLQMMAFLPS